MGRRQALPRALRIGVIPALLALALPGCASAGAGGTGTASAPPATTASPGTPAAPDADAGTPDPPAAGSTPITFELDGREMPGELDSTPASASLIDQLPLTLPLRDLGGQEKVAELPAPLDLDGAPEASDAPALTIGYYVPDQRLILYYDDVGSHAGIVPLGAYEDTVGLRDLPDGTSVTIRSAD
jgi:hypothetical protein